MAAMNQYLADLVSQKLSQASSSSSRRRGSFSRGENNSGPHAEIVVMNQLKKYDNPPPTPQKPSKTSIQPRDLFLCQLRSKSKRRLFTAEVYYDDGTNHHSCSSTTSETESEEHDEEDEEFNMEPPNPPTRTISVTQRTRNTSTITSGMTSSANSNGKDRNILTGYDGYRQGQQSQTSHKQQPVPLVDITTDNDDYTSELMMKPPTRSISITQRTRNTSAFNSSERSLRLSGHDIFLNSLHNNDERQQHTFSSLSIAFSDGDDEGDDDDDEVEEKTPKAPERTVSITQRTRNTFKDKIFSDSMTSSSTTTASASSSGSHDRTKHTSKSTGDTEQDESVNPSDGKPSYRYREPGQERQEERNENGEVENEEAPERYRVRSKSQEPQNVYTAFNNFNNNIVRRHCSTSQALPSSQNRTGRRTTAATTTEDANASHPPPVRRSKSEERPLRRKISDKRDSIVGTTVIRTPMCTTTTSDASKSPKSQSRRRVSRSSLTAAVAIPPERRRSHSRSRSSRKNHNSKSINDHRPSSRSPSHSSRRNSRRSTRASTTTSKTQTKSGHSRRDSSRLEAAANQHHQHEHDHPSVKMKQHQQKKQCTSSKFENDDDDLSVASSIDSSVGKLELHQPQQNDKVPNWKVLRSKSCELSLMASKRTATAASGMASDNDSGNNPALSTRKRVPAAVVATGLSSKADNASRRSERMSRKKSSRPPPPSLSKSFSAVTTMKTTSESQLGTSKASKTILEERKPNVVESSMHWERTGIPHVSRGNSKSRASKLVVPNLINDQEDASNITEQSLPRDRSKSSSRKAFVVPNDEGDEEHEATSKVSDQYKSWEPNLLLSDTFSCSSFRDPGALRPRSESKLHQQPVDILHQVKTPSSMMLPSSVDVKLDASRLNGTIKDPRIVSPLRRHFSHKVVHTNNLAELLSTPARRKSVVAPSICDLPAPSVCRHHHPGMATNIKKKEDESSSSSPSSSQLLFHNHELSASHTHKHDRPASQSSKVDLLSSSTTKLKKNNLRSFGMNSSFSMLHDEDDDSVYEHVDRAALPSPVGDQHRHLPSNTSSSTKKMVIKPFGMNKKTPATFSMMDSEHSLTKPSPSLMLRPSTSNSIGRDGIDGTSHSFENSWWDPSCSNHVTCASSVDNIDFKTEQQVAKARSLHDRILSRRRRIPPPVPSPDQDDDDEKEECFRQGIAVDEKKMQGVGLENETDEQQEDSDVDDDFSDNNNDDSIHDDENIKMVRSTDDLGYLQLDIASPSRTGNNKMSFDTLPTQFVSPGVHRIANRGLLQRMSTRASRTSGPKMGSSLPPLPPPIVR